MSNSPAAPLALPAPGPYPRRWYTVTGADFARSIAWARQQPANPLTTALAAHRSPLTPP